MLGIEGSDDEAATYIGEQALRVTCVQRTDGSRYVLRRPMKRGRIDFGSLSTEAVMCELQVCFREDAQLISVLGTRAGTRCTHELFFFLYHWKEKHGLRASPSSPKYSCMNRALHNAACKFAPWRVRRRHSHAKKHASNDAYTCFATGNMGVWHLQDPPSWSEEAWKHGMRLGGASKRMQNRHQNHGHGPVDANEISRNLHSAGCSMCMLCRGEYQWFVTFFWPSAYLTTCFCTFANIFIHISIHILVLLSCVPRSIELGFLCPCACSMMCLWLMVKASGAHVLVLL